MKIWVDADACPSVIKDILYHAAERVGVSLTLVANQPLRVPQSEFIDTVLVPGGFDVADDEIVARITPGDLVITADIPLAAAVIENNAHALNPRGEFYSVDNIAQRLTMRNFMEEMRNIGEVTGGPAPFGPKNQQAFANELDRFLQKNFRG